MDYDIIIIGFGISGISMAKECVKRKKKFIIFEKENSFGGVWQNAHDKSELQTHKTFYEFCEETSMPREFKDYPSKNELLIYLKSIIEKYSINKNVLYNFKVSNIERVNDVYIVNNKYKSKYIAICCGNNNKLKKIKVLNDYTGKIIYSKYIKNFDFNKLNDKNVLIIGNGATACDVIKNIHNIDSKLKVICVYKSPKYYIDKFIFGFPISLFLNELVLLLFKNINLAFYRIIVKLINFIFFGNVLDIPYEKINSNNLVGSNIIPTKMKNESLIYIKDTIKFTSEKNVICSKNILLNIDYIFCCNGYSNYVSFIDKIPKKRYLGIFNKDYKNIGFIGYNPSYNFPKICEKQSNIFLDFIDNKMNINNYYSRKIYDNVDYTYNLYDYLKL
jgi:hypothetical protein